MTDAMDFNRVSAAALQRWHELAPEQARTAVLEEITRPRPRFDIEVLGLIGDDALPTIERALLEHFAQRLEDQVGAANIASLIQRYATRGIEPEIVRILDENIGKWPCSIQESLLAYLLKVDPAAALPRLETAMSAGGPRFSGCSLLPQLGKLWNDPLLQDIAIKSLGDPNPLVVVSAAQYLQKYGSASAEDALWERFTNWSAQWKERAAELRYIPGAGTANMSSVYQTSAGQNLFSALADGHGWVLDQRKLLRLLELSVGPDQQRSAEEYLRRWQQKPWTIFFGSGNSPSITIMHYRESSIESAKIKLSQFPRGTRFQWIRNTRRSDQEERVLEELSSFAATLGIVIEPLPVR